MMEISPAQMPRFGESDKFIFHTPIPARGGGVGHARYVNDSSDLKIQLTFGNSLLVPWIKVYDSKAKKSLETLVLTFSKDKYNLVRVQQETVYKAASNKVSEGDTRHPSITAFEMRYQWHGAEDQDNPHGIFVMFITCVAAASFLLVLLRSATAESAPRQSGGGGGGGGSKNTAAVRRNSKHH